MLMDQTALQEVVIKKSVHQMQLSRTVCLSPMVAIKRNILYSLLLWFVQYKEPVYEKPSVKKFRKKFKSCYGQLITFGYNIWALQLQI